MAPYGRMRKQNVNIFLRGVAMEGKVKCRVVMVLVMMLGGSVSAAQIDYYYQQDGNWSGTLTVDAASDATTIASGGASSVIASGPSGTYYYSSDGTGWVKQQINTVHYQSISTARSAADPLRFDGLRQDGGVDHVWGLGGYIEKVAGNFVQVSYAGRFNYSSLLRAGDGSVTYSWAQPGSLPTNVSGYDLIYAADLDVNNGYNFWASNANGTDYLYGGGDALNYTAFSVNSKQYNDMEFNDETQNAHVYALGDHGIDFLWHVGELSVAQGEFDDIAAWGWTGVIATGAEGTGMYLFNGSTWDKATISGAGYDMLATGEYGSDADYGARFFALSQVPEPTTLLLLALGGVAMRRRR